MIEKIELPFVSLTVFVCLEITKTGIGSYLPTMRSSRSVAVRRRRRHRSMVNSVEEELKMDVNDDMMADSITAISRPRNPGNQTAHRLS